MKRLPAPPAALPALLLAFCTLFAPLAAQALTIAKGVPFYARDMEYYYREQRAETLPGILRTFDAQGVLADSRKQLALAAFLAEVLRATLRPDRACAARAQPEPRRTPHPGLGCAPGPTARR